MPRLRLGFREVRPQLNLGVRPHTSSVVIHPHVPVPAPRPSPSTGQYAQLRARTRERRLADSVAGTPTATRAARGAALGVLLVAVDRVLVANRGAVHPGPRAARAALLVIGVALCWAVVGAAGAIALRARRRRGWPW